MDTKTTVTIYHKPTCSKSREAMAFLKAHGIEPNVIEYMNEPLNAEEIKALLKKLGVSPMDIIRTKEPIYAEKFKGKKLTDEKLIQAFVKYPILLQRPILVKGKKAVVGRSKEELKAIL